MPAALAILAHPDDAEFLCAGTLVRLACERGWSIHIATMTPGDCQDLIDLPSHSWVQDGSPALTPSAATRSLRGTNDLGESFGGTSQS